MYQNRLVHFYTLIAVLFCAALAGGSAFAADVTVRTGIHAKYSRLVFDWPKRVDYKIKRDEKSKLVITFEEKASLNTKPAEKTPVANIENLTIISKSPLSVSIDIPEQSRIRDLRAGNKIVVDVYNPPGGAQKKDKLAVSGKPQNNDQKKESPSKHEDVSETHPDQKELTPPSHSEYSKQNTVKLAMREQPTMATISSTQKFGMAAFILDGRIWMVNDRSNLLLKPQLSGPLADKLTPVNEVDTEKGKAFTIPLLDGRLVKGKGGGILWRVMMGKDLEIKSSAEPVRSGVKRDKPRSGSILWPLKNARSVIDVQDPGSGKTIKVVTVSEAEESAGPARKFIDFDVLHSPIGLAIVPKVGDLKVQIVRGGVEVSTPEGLTLVDGVLLASMTKAKKHTGDDHDDNGQRLFDFKAWQIGGVSSLHDNKRIITAGLKDKTNSEQVEDIVTLGKMYVSNAMGPESLGAMNFALSELPSLRDNPEFMAIYGVASALTYRNIDAFQYLSLPILKPFKEVNYWRASVLADEGDWQQAADIMPQGLSILHDYPALLQNRLVPKLAEVALRAGDLDKAQELLSIVEENEKTLMTEQKAALNYLQGELARQRNDLATTKKLWEPLTIGIDDLHRAKAGLALTRLRVDKGELNIEKAIDNLERLRYAWRGDQLEVQINYWLGRTYFESGQFIKGLKIMREAASYDPGTPLGKRVTAEMADVFSELFLSERLTEVSPLDAVGLYDEFKELVPLDERGDRIIERLAEHLVQADLLTRSGDLLKYQLDHRLKDSEIYRVGIRLAAIRLLDRLPDQAISALDIAATQLEKMPEEMKTPPRYRAVTMLRARALSRKGRPDQALEMLNDLSRTPEMNRLRADIAWTAGYWDDAAEALGDVIVDQNLSLTRPLEEEDAELLLQRGIALNLSSDRIALANMREKYSDLMSQTPKAKTFEVITRPRQSGALADRDTLLSIISEVDLFEDFLNSYKSAPTPTN